MKIVCELHVDLVEARELVCRKGMLLTALNPFVMVKVIAPCSIYCHLLCLFATCSLY